mgnify:CR=1 FL=1
MLLKYDIRAKKRNSREWATERELPGGVRQRGGIPKLAAEPLTLKRRVGAAHPCVTGHEWAHLRQREWYRGQWPSLECKRRLFIL